jgi:hypothetical protein
VTALERRGPLFWGSAAAGWAIVAFGAWLVIERADATDPPSFLALFVGLALVHDLLLAPALSGAATLVAARVRPERRVVVASALLVSGALVAVALPPLLGDPADNLTILPRDYALGLSLALAFVWAVAAVALLARRRS